MADPHALTLAVVGHTNTGKTSLLRTLTRNPGFGDIDDQPGTTRHVEGARLLIDGRAVRELFDTPGLEPSMALLEYLAQIAPPATRAPARQSDVQGKRVAGRVGLGGRRL